MFSKRKGHKHKPTWKIEHFKKTPQRSPYLPMIDTEEQNGYLSLTFQFTLSNVDLTIKDSKGDKVVNEQSTMLFEGKTILMPTDENAYPYSIEITSPTISLAGEVTLEEY